MNRASFVLNFSTSINFSTQNIQTLTNNELHYTKERSVEILNNNKNK